MSDVSTTMDVLVGPPATRKGTLSRTQLGKRRRKQIGDILTWIVLLIGGVLFAAPFIWMVSSSLKSLRELYVFPPRFIPEVIQWDNYIEVWRRLPFHLFFLNSTYIAVAVTFGTLFTGSLAGYAFARLRFPGREKIFMVYISTMMIPWAITLIPNFILMRTFNWVNTHKALIIPGLFGAWSTFMIRQFVMTIPHELEDAALIDGCSRFGIYSRIILPLCKPVMATLGIFRFMGSWNAFLWPLVMITSMDKKTLPLGMAAFRAMSAMKTPWHLIMSASVLTVTPLIVIFILGQKYYVRGIVTTGLKGVT